MTFLIHSAAALTGRVARAQAQRCFATSSVVRKDYVQDLYIRELRAYKPAPAAKDAHVGAVRDFKTPAVPEPPALPSNLDAELKEYEASEPTLAPKSVSAKEEGAAPKEGKGEDAKLSGPALLAFLEQDLPKDDLHHH